MATQADISALAGVSQKTVSRCLREPQLVDAGTLARVRRVMDRLDYRENRLPQLLKMGYLPVIGLLLPSVRKSYFAGVIEGAESAASAGNWQVAVSSFGASASAQKQQVDLYDQLRVAATVITPAEENADWLASRRWSRPVIQFNDRLPGLPFPVVSTHERVGIELAMEHLWSLGHRHIGFARTPSHTSSNLQRQLCFGRFMTDRRGDGATPSWFEGGSSVEAGRALAGHWEALPAPKRPTALLCDHDDAAAGLAMALSAAGWSVPDDLSVVGYGGLEWVSHLPVAITSVDQRAQLLGETLVRVAIDSVAGQRPVPPETLVEPLLITRASCGRPRQ